MWKFFFDIAYAFSFLIFIPRARRRFRDWYLFGYREKLDDLLQTLPELQHKKMRLTKGGGSLAFIFDNGDVYRVRKREAEATSVFHVWPANKESQMRCVDIYLYQFQKSNLFVEKSLCFTKPSLFPG